MKLDDDDFTLFALPQRQRLERGQIDARWRALQGEVHPDRFAAQGAAAQRLAMQWAVRVNEAYQRLKNPLKRAAYLCELRGQPIRAEDKTAMPGAFLLQQMQWREALEEADSEPAVQALAREMAADEQARLLRLQTLIDDAGDMAEAAREVRALMFVERFAHDVHQRLETLEH